MIKVGIVGLGGIAGIHICAYNRLKNVCVVAASDALGEGAKSYPLVKDKSVKIYTDTEEMLRCEELDVIDICAPTHLHRQLAVAALESGHHVLCEKPMAASYVDALCIARTAERCGKLFMTAQVIRFSKPYQYLKSVVDSGELGALVSLSLHRQCTAPRWRLVSMAADAKRNGGVMLDLSIHDIDFIYSMLGEPDSICGVYRPVKEGDPNDCFCANLIYGKTTVTLSSGFYGADVPFSNGYYAIFEKGYIDYVRGTELSVCGKVLDVRDEFYPDEGADINISMSSNFVEEIAYFIGCVENHRAPLLALPESTAGSLGLAERIADTTLKI